MSRLTILYYPDAALRKKAARINSIDENITVLADDMLETMYAEGGIGLAATQVNVQKRIVVMDLSEDKNQPNVLINPEIIASEGLEQTQEGCLSVPDYYEIVERAEKVKCRYLKLDGTVVEQDADGLLAVCMQHEIDHLDGKLFIDYLSPLKRQRLRKKIEKQDKHLQVVL